MAGMNNFSYGYTPYVGYNQPIQPQIPYVQNNEFVNRQQMNNTSTIRIVENIKSVENIDIPMDGNSYYFLKADGTEIYAKSWTKDMTTKINKFILEQDEVENVPKFEDTIKGYLETMEGNICNRFDSLNERLNKLDRAGQNRNSQNKSKEISK